MAEEYEAGVAETLDNFVGERLGCCAQGGGGGPGETAGRHDRYLAMGRVMVYIK